LSNKTFRSGTRLGKGIEACHDIAEIVKGDFFSGPSKEGVKKWVSRLWLPIHQMPNELSEALGEHLLNIT
jgi:hypothetical protein